jgi:predicted transposase YdaD
MVIDKLPGKSRIQSIAEEMQRQGNRIGTPPGKEKAPDDKRGLTEKPGRLK